MSNSTPPDPQLEAGGIEVNGFEIYVAATKLAMAENQVVGEKSDYYVTLEQLETLCAEPQRSQSETCDEVLCDTAGAGHLYCNAPKGHEEAHSHAFPPMMMPPAGKYIVKIVCPKCEKSDLGKPPLVEFDIESDGRIIADIPSVPGAMAYGATREEAEKKARQIAASVTCDDPFHDRKAAK